MRFYGGFFVILLGALTLFLASVANGPDRELHFVRQAHSSSSVQLLGQALQNSASWPQWFYSLEKVASLNPEGKELPHPSPVLAGSTLKLYFNDRKSPWSHMEITAQVLEITPARLVLRILHDSKGKLTRLFDRLEWEVQLQPLTEGTSIMGKALAHTAHWRSRLFGSVTERILMNQVFYPNVMQMAQLKSIENAAKNHTPTLNASDALISLPAAGK